MNTKPTTKQPATVSNRDAIKTYAARLKADPGHPHLAICGPEDPKAYRVFRRRAAAVQAAYDSAPAGAEAIADAVWRKLQSFRPKLTSLQMRAIYPSDMRLDVRVKLLPKVGALEDREIAATEAADDARRAKRVKAPASRPHRAVRRAA